MQQTVNAQWNSRKYKNNKNKGVKKEYIRECDQSSTPMEWISIYDVLRYISSQGISVFIRDFQWSKKYLIDKMEMTEVQSLIYANKIRLKKKLPPFHLESITTE